jgi:acyl carrier protein
MNKISNMKKAIGVFRSYGIPLSGKNKSANFYKELRMDRVFVDGLIFELEFELNKIIKEEKIALLETPSELLHELLAA